MIAFDLIATASLALSIFLLCWGGAWYTLSAHALISQKSWDLRRFLCNCLHALKKDDPSRSIIIIVSSEKHRKVLKAESKEALVSLTSECYTMFF